MIITRTPFRISFFGGGTDFPEYYHEHGGACLLTTINQYCYISVHPLAPLFTYRFHASYAKTELLDNPASFQHPLIRECLLFLEVTRGMEIVHVADLPGGTGLGTSSSFTVALLHALHLLLGHDVSPEKLAQEAIVIERDRVGDPGGHQDQFAAALGGLQRLDFGPGHQITSIQPEVPPERMAELDSNLLMFYTGMQRPANEIQELQSRNTRKNVDVLTTMREMVPAAEDILSGSEDMRAFGDLLDESWRCKRGLVEGISNDLVDHAYEAAMGAGARGGKLLGAGGRGFLLFYVEREKQDAVRGALAELTEVDFAFSHEGSRVIHNSQS